MMCGWMSITVGMMFPVRCEGSVGQPRIERLRGAAKDPFALGRAREREGGLRLPEDPGERAGGGGEVRAPRDARGAERLEHRTEEGLRRRLAPFLRLDVDRRPLQETLAVLGEIEQRLVGREGRAFDQLRPR